MMHEDDLGHSFLDLQQATSIYPPILNLQSNTCLMEKWRICVIKFKNKTWNVFIKDYLASETCNGSIKGYLLNEKCNVSFFNFVPSHSKICLALCYFNWK